MSVGDAVGLVGTPFGNSCPRVFHGFLSRGVISAQNGPICFTDAPAARGVEGAPVIHMVCTLDGLIFDSTQEILLPGKF